MKISIDIDLTPQEAQELFVPGELQQEFQMKTYTAYVQALQSMFVKQFDAYGFAPKEDPRS